MHLIVRRIAGKSTTIHQRVDREALNKMLRADLSFVKAAVHWYQINGDPNIDNKSDLAGDAEDAYQTQRTRVRNAYYNQRRCEQEARNAKGGSTVKEVTAASQALDLLLALPPRPIRSTGQQDSLEREYSETTIPAESLAAMSPPAHTNQEPCFFELVAGGVVSPVSDKVPQDSDVYASVERAHRVL